MITVSENISVYQNDVINSIESKPFKKNDGKSFVLRKINKKDACSYFREFSFL